jgi:signal transduction histidine kinase
MSQAGSGRRTAHRAAHGAKDEIRILLLEDIPSDGELVRHALRVAGISFVLERVETRSEFIAEITRFRPDLILSDFSLPSFNGMAALEIALQKCPDVPFIFVTGSLGEEVAIDTLKKGATDYVLKHRLTRLAPAIHRALREACERTQRKRAEEQLRESHKQLRSLSVFLQYVREEERTRISREVHDELGQALTGLKLQLTWLGSRLPKRVPVLHEKVDAMSEHIDDTIQTVRRIATALRPGVLDTAGLLAAIEWQAHEFERQTGIQCRVHTNIQDTLWDEDLNTAFFRIFQETLTNIIRHANATRVNVHLTEAENEFVLEVKDNGRGISEAEIRNTNSIGLLGMQERAALLGGTVSWRGQSGRGTAVTVRIPRPQAPRTKPNRGHENPAR